MLTRKVKACFYLAAGPAMAAYGAIYRLLFAPRTGIVKAHLGPGQNKYIAGWINVDANIFTAKCDVWADLRRKLPFADETVDAIYSHHVIEHLPNLRFHFCDIYRCLKPGGVARIGGPNGDWAIRKFLEGDCDWFGDFPDSRRSIGGRLENFIFCRQEHLTILTQSYFEELAVDAGFARVDTCLPATQTNFPALFGRDVLGTEHESTPHAPHTLIVEAQRPL
jgi:predicted SAM-dependent methyltransferase